MSHRFAPSAAAYAQLREDAGLVVRDDRLRMGFTGAKAAETITGLVTNDILALAPGHGAYAAALTAKGKIIADLRIYCRSEGDLLVDTSAAAGPGFAAMIKKYVNPRLAKYRDETAESSCSTVIGPHARAVIAHALSVSPSTFDLLPPFAHASLPFGDATIMVARTPEFGIEAFDCFAPASSAATLRTALQRAGAATADSAAVETLRVEAGRPAWGIDMTEETLTQEANLDALHAVSYTKGCYTGQETVARVHFRGHVNRFLRGLKADRFPSGALTVFAGDKEVGDVRSLAESPRLGGLALAMLRREVEDGATVSVRGAEGGEVVAAVSPLPFEP